MCLLFFALLQLQGAPLRAEEHPQDDATAPSGETNAEERALLLYQVAERRYEEGRFEESIVLLREALALADLCPLHNNLGRALQETGQWVEAREEYRAFLACSEDQHHEERIRARIRVLEGLIAIRSDEAVPGVEEANDVQVDGGPSQGDAVAPRRSPWPWVIVGTGAAALTAGVVFGALFSSERSIYDDPATSQVDASEAYFNGRTYGITATAALVAGGVVALVGLIWGVIDLVRAAGRTTAEPAR